MTERDGSPDGYIYNLGARFDAIVRLHGARPALRSSDGTTTSYADLGVRAAAAAAALHRQGVLRRQVVAFYVDKTASTYAAMLGCLKLGAPYVMLDTESPAERLGRILASSRPVVLLHDHALPADVAALCNELSISPLNLERLEEVGDGGDPDFAAVVGTDPAYVMFTSGSTGMPKGVAISHASVLNFIDWCRTQFQICPDDVLTGANHLHFDNSVFDFYASLFNGAALLPMPRSLVTNARSMVESLERNGATFWFSVPSLLIYLSVMKMLGPARLPTLRAFSFGGEGYPKAELRKLYDWFGARAALWNVYGPTECTCICSAHKVTLRDLDERVGLAPLGAIAPNFTWRLIDQDGAPAAPGEPGELLLGGPQVALGYYNDPARSAASFVPDPLDPLLPVRMYRTGDLIRCDADDGLLYFCGRADNQIKHMGYRIELEEIEAALAALDGVAQAAAVYIRGDARFGRLVAAVAGDDLDAAKLTERLRHVLPSYMVPGEIVIFESLPKNANGKVDRIALAQHLHAGAALAGGTGTS